MFGKNILIGCDPELFMQNPNSGEFISAHSYVQGSKRTPFPVDRGAIQLDGTAAEFNIHPAANVDQFVRNITTVRQELDRMVQPSGYQLVAEPVASFDPIYFDREVPLSAKELGCDPDFNGWMGIPNDPPNGEVPFRTGAGHIHLGWTTNANVFSPEHFMLGCEVARQLDYYVGAYSLLWDKDNRRRELYGKAGAFRPKSYGMEYRVPSNAWLKSEVLIRWVYEACIKALEDLDRGIRQEDFHGDLAQQIINNNDLDWLSHTNISTGLPRPPVLKAA